MDALMVATIGWLGFRRQVACVMGLLDSELPEGGENAGMTFVWRHYTEAGNWYVEPETDGPASPAILTATRW